jgi:hypothetical protein
MQPARGCSTSIEIYAFPKIMRTFPITIFLVLWKESSKLHADETDFYLPFQMSKGHFQKYRVPNEKVLFSGSMRLQDLS